MKELRLQSGPESDFRLAVAVDGVNALWGRSTIKKEDKSAVRKHIHNPVMPNTCLHAFSTDRKSYVSLFLAVHQVDPEELTLVYNLRKLMKNDWVRKGNDRMKMRILYYMSDLFLLTYTLFVSDWRRHHHHCVTDGVSLHVKICLLASRAARRGQRSFYYTL